MFIEGRHKRKNQTTFPVEVSIKYILQNERNYIVAVARDISERKQAENELRASEDKFKSHKEGELKKN